MELLALLVMSGHKPVKMQNSPKDAVLAMARTLAQQNARAPFTRHPFINPATGKLTAPTLSQFRKSRN